ncbi:hypothetical protein LguiB_021072 [Lonicera macranthoides]
MNSEFEKSLQDLVNHDISSSSNIKHKRKRSLWASLPFSLTEKLNDELQPIGSNLTGLRALCSSHSTPSSADELTEFHEKKLCAETSALEVCSEDGVVDECLPFFEGDNQEGNEVEC